MKSSIQVPKYLSMKSRKCYLAMLSIDWDTHNESQTSGGGGALLSQMRLLGKIR